MADYAFVTHWHIAAPVERVWDAIYDFKRWPSWWRGVVSVVETKPGDAQGIGGEGIYTWRSALPYTLMFTVRTVRVETHAALGAVVAGDLEGTGLWRFEAEPGGTHVRYDWNVRTTQRWIQRLEPIARPLFIWNHDVIMRWGEEGLRRYVVGAGASKTEREA